MRQVFAQMLELAEPESYEFKGENTEDFFAPFMPVIKAAIWGSSEYVLNLLRNNPKDAAIRLLVQDQVPHLNMACFRTTIDHAIKFDELYAEKKQNR